MNNCSSSTMLISFLLSLFSSCGKCPSGESLLRRRRRRRGRHLRLHLGRRAMPARRAQVKVGATTSPGASSMPSRARGHKFAQERERCVVGRARGRARDRARGRTRGRARTRRCALHVVRVPALLALARRGWLSRYTCAARCREGDQTCRRADAGNLESAAHAHRSSWCRPRRDAPPSCWLSRPRTLGCFTSSANLNTTLSCEARLGSSALRSRHPAMSSASLRPSRVFRRPPRAATAVAPFSHLEAVVPHSAAIAAAAATLAARQLRPLSAARAACAARRPGASARGGPSARRASQPRSTCRSTAEAAAAFALAAQQPPPPPPPPPPPQQQAAAPLS
jgi:hypothetical protein